MESLRDAVAAGGPATGATPTPAAPTPAAPNPAVPAGAGVPHGPLPALLMLLTVATGLVDAVSYLRLGHVFVANMTGNVVFLGFAVADARQFSIPASLAAAAAFLLGALGGGRLGSSLGAHRGRLLALSIGIEAVAVAAALLASVLMPQLDGGQSVRYELIVLLALAMGLQNAVARRLGVPDLTTTVLTLTLTGLMADSRPAGGTNPRPWRRLLAATTMFCGAAVGAYLIFHVGLSAVLALTLLLLVVTGAAASRYWSSTDAWTVGGR
jgi:uncharacterized membrane protein YoaK (UPF0700 family)